MIINNNEHAHFVAQDAWGSGNNVKFMWKHNQFCNKVQSFQFMPVESKQNYVSMSLQLSLALIAGKERKGIARKERKKILQEKKESAEMVQGIANMTMLLYI